jgi:hypothetical protein
MNKLKISPMLCRQIDNNRWSECLEVWKLKNDNEICPNVLVSEKVNYDSDNNVKNIWVYAIISYFNEKKQEMQPMKVISFIKTKIPDLYENNICDYIFRRPDTWVKQEFFH